MAKRKHKQRYTGPNLTAESGLAVGDTITVAAGPMDDRGNCTAEHRGAPVTVHGAIPGETVDVEVVKVYPERVAAKTVAVREADADRVLPPCRYFGECTGCQWQQISYARQLEVKRGLVADALRQYPETRDAPVEPVIASPNQYGYRNHARFSVGRGDESGVSGFVNADSRKFVRIDECQIMDDRINQTVAQLQGRLHRMTQWSIRVGVNSGDRIIQPLLPADIQDVESGRQQYTETINGIDFKVAASSFFQVNSQMIPIMVDTIVDMLEPAGDETLVDLYCGVGTFACLLADKVGSVAGIEVSTSAIENAEQNAEPFANVWFAPVDASSVAGVFAMRGEPVDYVIVDPPRRGCDDSTIRAIASIQPRKIIMVSCEPKTLAPDLAALCQAGYRLVKVQPLDMFPQTKHVETIALLVSRDL